MEFTIYFLALAENSKLNKGSVIILNRNKAVLNTSRRLFFKVIIITSGEKNRPNF
jgi:ribose 1,5-bisphosphokinase PhnN